MCDGIPGVGSIFNFLVATDTAASNAKMNKAKTAARDAKNQRNASESDLARFSQSLGNKKILEGAGRRYEAMTENLFRSVDAASLDKTMSGLVLSEKLGAASAAAASAGIGGSSVEMYNKTLETTYALQTNVNDRHLRSSIYGAQQEIGRILPDAVDSFNKDVYVANQDYTYLGPTKGPSVLGNLITLGVAAGASALGAPQIGEALLKAKTASMQANYGDAAGASKNMQGAFESFKIGYGQARSIFNGNNSGANFGETTPWADSYDSGIRFG